MRITVLSVGKLRRSDMAEAIREYEVRAARYWTFESIDVREENARALTEHDVREREGGRLLDRVPAGSQVVACDPGGSAMTSEAFALWLAEFRDRAQDVAFAIGGAFGLSDAVRSRAVRRLSLSPWTLPHELARLVLAEQLYRAGTILRGEPYHK